MSTERGNDSLWISAQMWTNTKFLLKGHVVQYDSVYTKFGEVILKRKKWKNNSIKRYKVTRMAKIKYTKFQERNSVYVLSC